MAFFSTDFVTFLKELAANNHKDWFDANRKRYEKEVKEPFKAFVGVMINHLQQEDPKLLIEPKHCIFRINRDIRFSKDKTPYKTTISAAIARGGKKDMVYPGLYFELNPEKVGVYGGVYMPDKQQLEDIRYYIANNLEEWQKLLKDKEFTSKFETIRGEKNKRLPKDLQPVGEQEPTVYNKQFYYMAKLSPKLITDPKLDEKLMEYHHAALPIRTFLAKAVGAWDEAFG